ncbi:MAG: hypothetical protein ABR525_07190 [Candidatus Limnocylindria bacterium]
MSRAADISTRPSRALRTAFGFAAAACLALTACTAAPPIAAPSATPFTAPPTVTPSPSPTLPPAATAFLGLLADRDAAQRSGDASRMNALIAPDAPQDLRDRELAVADVISKQHMAAPERRFQALAAAGQLAELDVTELDDQGRIRPIRYFAATVEGRLLLTEPAAASLGQVTVAPSEHFDVRAYPLDERQAAAASGLLEDALTSLVARLGEPYRPAARIVVHCDPVAGRGVAPLASAYVTSPEIHFLTSSSMIVSTGAGSDWSRIVVTHELSHVLLFMRGDGPFVLVEGIPLWLTDDRRQAQLDRIVAAGGVWDLDHLVRGPADANEFFAAYAQASSFVRFVAATYGPRAPIAVWELGTSAPFTETFARGAGVPLADAYAAWRASLAR